MVEFENEDKRAVKKIWDAKGLYQRQRQIADDAAKLAELAKGSLREAIKCFMTTYDYAIPMIQEAQKELGITDRRRKRSNLLWLNGRISKDFFDNKIEVEVSEIVWYRLSHEAVNVHFNIAEDSYYISIPLKDNLGPVYDDYTYGKFYIAKRTSSSSAAILESSYDVADVRKYILENILG